MSITTTMSILEDIKKRFRYAGVVEKLIYVNIGVFLFVFIVNTFSFLFQTPSNFILEWFALPASFSEFLTKPWTIVTYGFLHTGFIHILFNLIALYYIGNLFKQYFTAKQLLNFYILGTFFGGLIFVISYNIFPAFQSQVHNNILLGASAGISAIFIGVATYIPNYEVRFPLIGYVKLWILACIWVAIDVIQIPVSNAGGHLAHLGGALFGYLYVFYNSNKQLTIYFNTPKIFQKRSKKTPLKTVHKAARKPSYTSQKSKSTNQKEIDSILDKIGKSGYDTLTKEEKEFLFKQGKK